MLLRNFSLSVFGLVISGLVLAALTLLAGCEGSATQTTTGHGLNEHGIFGTLVDTHGNPVPGAQVKAWPVNRSPNGVAKYMDSLKAVTVETDGEGKYSLTNLEVGIYNIFGEKNPGQGSVLIPRVKYLEMPQNLGADTLKAPGVIAGKAADSESHIGIGLVFCYLQGSTYVAVTDSTGAFLLTNVPEGSYRMNYFAQGFSSAVDSPVIVTSGATTSLSIKNLTRDLNLQPPAPRNITAAYDSLTGQVQLHWNRVQVADFKSYTMTYSDEPSHGTGYEVGWPMEIGSDTFYRDDLGYYYALGDFQDTAFVRTYQIRSKDQEGNLSPAPNQSVSVRIIPPLRLSSKFTVQFLGGQVNTPFCSDTLKFALNVTAGSLPDPKIIWTMRYSYFSMDSISRFSSGLDTIRTSVGYHLVDTLAWNWKGFISDGSARSRPYTLELRALLPLAPDLRAGAVAIPIAVDLDGCYSVQDPEISGPGKEY